MPQAEKVHRYLARLARSGSETVDVPGFALFFDLENDAPWASFAMPTEEVSVNTLETSLDALQNEFRKRNRTLRIHFIKESFPSLPQALGKAGYQRFDMRMGMICTPETFTPLPTVDGVQVSQINKQSHVQLAQDFLLVQTKGFIPESDIDSIAPEQAQRFLKNLEGQAYLAYLNEQPVCAGKYARIEKGISDLGGLATLPEHRGRGIATYLTGYIVSQLFEQNVESVYLTAANAEAGRIYQRVGFLPKLTYVIYGQ